MAWLAIDDTDTTRGGCTTHTAWTLARAIDEAAGPLAPWRVEGRLRLVRLAPTIPARTRGNGALVIPLTHDGPAPDALAALQRLVDRHLPAPDPRGADPQPGAVFGIDPPATGLYGRAVAGPVTAAEAWAAARPGTVRLTDGPRRGEIGALAAAAWPMVRTTYEAVVYRSDVLHATDPTKRSEALAERRLVDASRAAVMATSGGFDNHDAATGRMRCVPRTPCPVFLGVRGTDAAALGATARRVVLAQNAQADVPTAPHMPATRCSGAHVFVTNHATGDHARHAHRGLGAHRVVRLHVEVTDMSVRRRGGHLFVDAQVVEGSDAGTTVTLAAYEPTKGMRDVVDLWAPGDRLTVLGRTAADGATVALEAFRVAHTVPRPVTTPNPTCPRCDRRMKSIGQDAGYRCRDCGTRRPCTTDAVPAPAALAPGAAHQVPDHVRGHLLPPVGGLPYAQPAVPDVGHWLTPSVPCREDGACGPAGADQASRAMARITS